MSNVIRLRTGLQNLNCSDASFAALCVPPLVPKKLSQQIFGQIKNGQREFESQDEADRFMSVLDTMQHLQEVVQPRVPIDWSNVLELKNLVIKTVEERRNADDPIVVRAWFVRLSITDFLKGVNSAGVILTNNYQAEAAAFEDAALAEACAKKVRELGVDYNHVRPVALTAPRRASTITRTLEQIGFTPVEVEV
jgi:hypothetical protein